MALEITDILLEKLLSDILADGLTGTIKDYCAWISLEGILKYNEELQVNETTVKSILDSFKNIPGIIDAKIDEDIIILYGENGDILLAQIIAKVSEHKNRIQSIDVKKPNLEAVFLHLTGKALRD